MQLLRKLTEAILYSNAFIGLCAVALTLTNQLSIEGAIHFDESLGFVFFSTMFTYSFLKFRGTVAATIHTSHRTWAGRHPQISRNIILISLIATIFFFAKLEVKAQLIVALLAIFTAFYGFVNIPFITPKRKLRDFGLVKTLLVALVWSVTTVIVPLARVPLEENMMVFLLLRRFLFILALTIPFEIKDMSDDREYHLNTLPLKYGISNTKLLAQGILILLMVILTVQYFFFDRSPSNMVAINLSLLVSIFSIGVVKEETREIWYYLVLDGMMILQFCFVYVAVTCSA